MIHWLAPVLFKIALDIPLLIRISCNESGHECELGRREDARIIIAILQMFHFNDDIEKDNK